jgi:hypothetical protein
VLKIPVGSTDKTLVELKIIEKFETAVITLDVVKTQPSEEATFKKVLDKGIIIIVEKPAIPYNTFKTKNDGKTILFDIDYLSNPTTSATDIVDEPSIPIDIYNAIMDYLNKELEKTE